MATKFKKQAQVQNPLSEKNVGWLAEPEKDSKITALDESHIGIVLSESKFSFCFGSACLFLVGSVVARGWVVYALVGRPLVPLL